MSNQKLEKSTEKIIAGMKTVFAKLLEEKKKQGEKLVVSRNGKIVYLSPEEFKR